MGKKVHKPLKKWQTGNFHIRLIQIQVGYGQRIEALEISDNERLWKVQIPQTWGAFSIIKELLESGEQTDKDVVQTLCTNFHCVCCVLDGTFHKDVMNAGVAYIQRVQERKPEVDHEYEDSVITMGEINAEVEDAEDNE